MPRSEAAALKPKVPRACCLCDEPTAEVREIRGGRPVRYGKILPGSRVLRLRMLDGSLSEHSLCARCTPAPRDLALIWARAAKLYATQASPEQTERFARNIPIGILLISDDEREPVVLRRAAS